MKLFADLIQEIESTTKTIPKVSALVHYFDSADDACKLWAIALLSGKRPKRNIPTTLMREWAAEQSKLPLWLFEDSCDVVGDLAEAIAILLPEPNTASDLTLDYWIRSLINLKGKEEHEKKAFILSAWGQLNRHQRFVFNKLITGGLRTSVTQKLMTKALAKHTEKDENTLAYKLISDWDPLKSTFESLILSKNATANLSKPYPFHLTGALIKEPSQLGNISDWQIERKWDGIRAQVIIRNGGVYIWSNEEELVTNQYPELHSLIDSITDGTVIDCEIICHDGELPLPYHILQSRIGKKSLSKKLLLDAPVRVIAYDILEHEGKDIRETSLSARRQILEEVLSQAKHDRFLVSEVQNLASWNSAVTIVKDSRKLHSEGILIRRRSSTYNVGLAEPNWWKWKVNPLTIDAVLIYVTSGQGGRSKVYTNYTFAVWDSGLLVPITKAYMGLTDEEHNTIHAFAKKNIIERFGPVRSIKPELVFEIAFDDIKLSKRHKSGIAVRCPRIHRWQSGKLIKEANTLDDLKKLLEKYR